MVQRHSDAHEDNGGNSSKRNDEETDCKKERSNQIFKGEDRRLLSKKKYRSS